MPDFNTPPLPRHPALQPLSRDHYVGLVQAQHLEKAAAKDAVERRAAVAAFLDAWDNDIAPHFADEERLLSNLADESRRRRLHEEHDRLRGLAEEARERRRQVDPGAEWTRTLGQTLNDHIRWEERDLFPSIQQRAADDLNELLPEADRIEASRSRGRGREGDNK